MNLFTKKAIYIALKNEEKEKHCFIYNGKNEIRRSPDDRTGASLAFNINHFATGYYGSFDKRK